MKGRDNRNIFLKKCRKIEKDDRKEKKIAITKRHTKGSANLNMTNFIDFLILFGDV